MKLKTKLLFQFQGGTYMSFPQKVKSTLWAIVDNMACNTACFVKKPKKDFTRNRKLGFAQLIRFFLSMESGCINHELLKYFYFLPDEIPSASSFIQQRPSSFPKLSDMSSRSLTFVSRQRALGQVFPHCRRRL